MLSSKAYAKPYAGKEGKALIMGINRTSYANFFQRYFIKMTKYLNKTAWQPEALRSGENRMTNSEWARLNSRPLG
jgi:hypothetical protein